ncbi:MAG TPA: cobalamin-dependent protein, partial [Candidatus Wallbacteria bacterium]|nr:cobalamin-dependent protein [Candidatus Wallbacteria bacterium]
MRVAFVYPTKIKKDSFFGFVLPSMALERLAAAVEDIAECELFDARFENKLMDEIVRFDPAVVCVNVKTTLYSKQSYDAADSIKKRIPGAVIVLGGLHATSCPEEALAHGDFVITGEGENSLREFILGVPKEKIGGLAYKSGGKITVNQKIEPPACMDSLKPPARHLRKPGYIYSAAGLIKMDLLET